MALYPPYRLIELKETRRKNLIFWFFFFFFFFFRWDVSRLLTSQQFIHSLVHSFIHSFISSTPCIQHVFKPPNPKPSINRPNQPNPLSNGNPEKAFWRHRDILNDSTISPPHHHLTTTSPPLLVFTASPSMSVAFHWTTVQVQPAYDNNNNNTYVQ